MDFFQHKGQLYSERAIIKVSQSYIDKYSTEKKQFWHYAKFIKKTYIDNKVHYSFNITNSHLAPKNIDYKKFYFISESELNDFIEEVKTPPIDIKTYEVFISSAKKDLKVEDLVFVWVIYIAVMVGSLIFKDFIIIWIIATIIFNKYRKGKFQDDN